MIPVGAFDPPVFIPDRVAIGRRPGLAAVTAPAGLAGNATIDPFAKDKLLRLNIRQRKVRHVKFGEQRRLFHFFLPVAHAEAKERYLVAIALAALAFQMAGVVPPLGFEIGVGIVVGGKREFASRQCELVCESGKYYKTADQCAN